MASNVGNINATVTLHDRTGKLFLSGPSGVPMQLGRVTFDPDAMDLDGIGAAHSTRGRVVRAFFWLLKAWPT